MKTIFLFATILMATVYSISSQTPFMGFSASSRIPIEANGTSTLKVESLHESKIAFASNGQLYVINGNGSNALGLTDDGLPIYGGHPTWSPDGKQIAFERITDDGLKAEIYVVNIDGSNSHPVHQSGRYPTWSPDGKHIAFSSRREGMTNIYVIDPDGSNLANLTSPAGGFQPAWSPDSKRIVYSAVYNQHIETYSMNSDGTNVTRVTNNANAATDYDGNFSWSPEGTKIAFKSARSGRNQIYVMNTDGSNVVRLTYAPYGDLNPAWSPDGKYLAFASDRGGPSNNPGADGIPVSDVYVINADGTGNPIRLTTNALANFSPAWKP